MYPVIFKIPIFGGLTVHSYGVMVAIGFLCAIAWITYESKRVGQNPSRALDLIFYILIAAIVGSRIFHVAISEREAFLENPLMVLSVWRGGLVFYGGFIASVLVSVWYVRKHKMNFLITSDIFAPAVSLGHAVGRIGCFLAGCCYGKVCAREHWYSVVFPNNQDSFAPGGVPLIPTQLFESAGELCIFLSLVVLSRFKKFDGQIMATYLILYSILRYTLEFFRGDEVRGFVIDPWLSTSQFVSLIIFACGVAMYVVLLRRKRKIGG